MRLHFKVFCGWMVAFLLMAGDVSAVDAVAEKRPPEAPITRIKVVPVESQNILGIGYHSRTKTLLVIFHDRDQRSYRYSGVSAGVYKKFLAAESKGKFFDSEIRKKYAFTQVKTDYDPAKVAAKKKARAKPPRTAGN